MYKVKFEFNGKRTVATAKDVSSMDADKLRICQMDEHGTFTSIDPEEYHVIADEAIELLYEEKYGKELNFEVA